MRVCVCVRVRSWWLGGCPPSSCSERHRVPKSKMKIILKVYRSKTPLTCQTTPTFGNNPNMLIYSQRAELPQRTTISSMWQTATNFKSLHNSLRIKVFNASNCYQRTKQNSIYQTAPNVLIYLQRDDLPLTCWATTNMLIYPNLLYYHFPLCTLHHPA